MMSPVAGWLVVSAAVCEFVLALNVDCAGWGVFFGVCMVGLGCDVLYVWREICMCDHAWSRWCVFGWIQICGAVGACCLGRGLVWACVFCG